jgi:hypothetical protein
MANRTLGNEKEIKLCYVTVSKFSEPVPSLTSVQPEKIAKSKSFVAMLQKLVNAAQLGIPRFPS